MDYQSDVELLRLTFEAIIKNHSTMGMQWKNLYLARVAKAILLDFLPESLPGEYDDMAGKARLLEQMLDYCHETDMPRVAIGHARDYRPTCPKRGQLKGSLKAA